MLSELAGKSMGRLGYSSDNKDVDTSIPSSPLAKIPVDSSSSSSLSNIAQSAYSGISSAYSNLYVPSLSMPNFPGRNATSKEQTPEEDHPSDASASISGLSKNSVNSKRNRRKSMLSPNLLTLLHNPYIGVRGGGRLHRAKPPHESMDAVRKLLYVVEDDKNKEIIAIARRPPTPTYENEYYEDKNVKMPFAPMTPSRENMDSTRTSTTDGSSATPRHRNSATEYTNSEREELLMHPLLSQQLATIDSMSRQSSSSIPLDKPALDQDSTTRAQSTTMYSNSMKASSSAHSPEETASQLTEGTLRALRDLALDEALALHNSLKYWSDRWERPIFSWFVAGPLVWFGWIDNTISGNTKAITSFGGGYDHSEMVGKRVSQIQAVLARRLMAIGELQHHLLRAGWQRGVAHWGFLGEGGNWAAVDGTDGRMGDDDDSSQHSGEDSDHEEEEDEFQDEDFNEPLQRHEDLNNFFAESQDYTDHATNAVNASAIKPLDLHKSSQKAAQRNQRYRLLRRETSEASVGSIGLHIDVPPPPSPFLASPRKLSTGQERRKHSSLYYANLHVRKNKGGHIQKDEAALAEWSIDALALIRRQLIRAANGKLSLPFSENWPFEHSAGNASVVEEQSNGMPVWAGMKYSGGSNAMNSKPRNRMETRGSCFSITEDDDNVVDTGGNPAAVDDTQFPKIGEECFENQSFGEDSKNFSPKKRSPSSQRSITSTKDRAVVGISNLPLMMNEVSGLLDVMEDIMDIQRARRLEKLKPPPWWRQNWFLVVLGPPSLGYLMYNNLIGRGQTWGFVKYAAEKMMDFFREHVVLPCAALYDEFTKGPESISDHAARDTATETLKKMIYSWLDET